MTSKRERLRNLFGQSRVHTPSSSKATPSISASHAPHPPRASEHRYLGIPGLVGRSPGLRATHEQDVLQDDLPDDIEFLSLDNSHYDEPNADDDDDDYDHQNELETIDEDDDGGQLHGSGSSVGGTSANGSSSSSRSHSIKNAESDDDMKDWPDDVDSEGTDKAVHLDSVPRSDKRLAAKQYKQPQFAKDLLALLQHDFKIPYWDLLGQEAKSEQLSIYKVSGSLTNAVFFISYPKSPNVTPEPSWEEPPTVLLRIYGPSSGNLISRKKELHVLNTLSVCYGIGPAILGTFANGRVEEYFESRALYKEEMRDPRTSRWIARRMRELHSVDLTLMELPADHPKSPFFGPRRTSTDSWNQHQQPQRPGIDVLAGAGGGADSANSGLSTSYASSIHSVGSSYSERFTSSSTYPPSPCLNARHASKAGVMEGPAPRKRRSISSLGGKADFSLEGDKINKPKSVVWQNIDSWTKEAKRVLRKVEKLEEVLRDFKKVPTAADAGDEAVGILEDVNPLHAPSLLVECRKLLDISAFQQEVKKYRKFIQGRETQVGRSKRVFAHNDAQCGNLLRLTPGGEEVMMPGLKVPHEMIIVVDFEYAGVNPRGFDIANHFLEWQTDYHHPTLSHSVTKHSQGPTILERQRFYRAYVPCDGGFDTGNEPSIPPLAEDDPRVQRLEEEVQLWTPASHAMYTVWSIVQATDDISRRIDDWIDDPRKAEEAEINIQKYRERATKVGTPRDRRPTLQRGKSGEEIKLEKPEAETSTENGNGSALPNGANGDVAGEELVEGLPALGDFDYLSYALERAALFRQEIARLGVI